jgi:hypothetical protein
VSKDVLEGISELEGVNIAQPILDVSIDDKFGQSQDFPTEMECVAESGFLALLSRERPKGM